MIVTLAGHVDHGKTSLVRALTGHDTDRLAEERRRGLTIDLGFAYVEDNGNTLGFVDVPGHHRFIHNMVAGVATMQYALLVVSADDGPMPQSREHLQILQLTGLTAGAIALTKVDQVDEQRRDAALEEIHALTAGTFLQDAPIFQTSTVTGAGIADLLAHLLQVSARYAVEQTPRQFRLAVDRAFNIKGSGLVVTGTVHAGNVAVDDELHVLPGNFQARVRGLHRQNKPSHQASVGDRCAINLGGISLGKIQRGSWLSAARDPGSQQLVIRLRVLEDFPRPVRHWTPVHVYHATSHTTARIATLEANALSPGDEGLIELVLDEPIFAKHDDRLVIRDQSLDVTLGGGAVIHNQPLPGRRRSASKIKAITAWDQPSAHAAFAALVTLGPLDIQEFQSCWDLLPEQLAELTHAPEIMVHDGFALRAEQWQGWSADVLDEITTRHQADATLQGIRANELTRPIPAEFMNAILASLVSDKRVTNQAGRYAPVSHHVSLTPAEASLFESIEDHLRERQPPSLGDLAKRLRESPANLRKRLQPLAGKGLLVSVSESRYFLPEQLGALIDIVDRLARDAPFTVRDFRDAAEIGRNTAIEVLEHLDAKGYTRRAGDTRSVVGDRVRVLPQMVD